jgi:hypothetical protein
LHPAFSAKISRIKKSIPNETRWTNKRVNMLANYKKPWFLKNSHKSGFRCSRDQLPSFCSRYATMLAMGVMLADIGALTLLSKSGSYFDPRCSAE